jgi:hypothetical protein
MAIEFRKTREEMESDFFTLCEEYGLSRTDRFVSGLINPIVDALEENFNAVYDLEKQSRIDTATDEWLASWGRLHGQSTEILEGGQDLSFDNVYIGTSDGRPVSDFIQDGTSLFLPGSIKIFDTNGREVLTTIDNLQISGDRAFTRVVIPSGLSITVAPGTYSTNVSLRDFSIRGLEDVPDLVAVVQAPISGTSTTLTDDDLRALIFDRALSRNKANGAAVRTTLQFSEVAKVVTKSFNSGSSSVSIYVEPRVGILSLPLAARLRSYLEDILPAGTRINIGAMVGSIVEVKALIKLPDNFSTSQLGDLKNTVRDNIVSEINSSNSGATVNFDSIAATVASVNALPSINIVDTRVNGKKVALSTYSCRDIEFVYTDALRVEVSA